MSAWKYTLAIKKGSISYKICKLIFGSDGSYYVTSPYHRAGRAVLAKVTYAEGGPEQSVVKWDECLEVASATDDEGRIKLSHHPDGFVQFSGIGLASGKDERGQIRGLGTYSWCLDLEVHGVAFAVALRGLEEFELLSPGGDSVIEFDVGDLSALSTADFYILEAHYFPPHARRFVQKQQDGRLFIWAFHPWGLAHPLRVAFPPEDGPRQNFFGFHLFAQQAADNHPPSTFSLSSAVGNLHRTPKGQTVGETLHCVYPKPDIAIERTLDYMKDANREPIV